MRTKAIVLALILLGSVLPGVGARHLSVGYEDAVGMGVDETPGNETVPPEAHARGTETNCTAHGGEANPSSLQKAASADAFCGDLVYYPEFEDTLYQESPSDQDFRSDVVGAFDIQVVNYVGTALEDWCQPFCQPGGDLAWQAVHTAGSEAGLTHGAEEASGNENDDRDQIYYAALSLPNAGRVAQDQTGLWEMNGFYSPVPYQAFAGFLYDSGGNAMSQQDIADRIDPDGLSKDTIPRVCGFSPEVNFVATAATGSCEINLHYRAPSDSEDFKGDYSYECDSPTYVCGAFAGGAWYGRIQCPFTCGPISETEYRVWHWVVAPTLDQTCKAREPGFAFTVDDTGDTSAERPFLAHDLDVYAPTASVVEEGRSVPALWDWSTDVAFDATEPVDDLLSQLPAVPDTSQLTATVEKDHRVEPNADPAGGLADTSQNLADDPDLQRTLDDCASLTSDETPDTADPWVDVVDGQAYLGTNGQRSGTGQEAQIFFYDGRGFGDETRGLYLNDEEHQDASNRPGPATVWTQGMVGMFTDKDDDGTYEQVYWGEKYDPQDIDEEGAWPMIWDLHVDEEGAIDPAAGCTRIGGESITEIAGDAGFGPHTGLAQLVYLNEPTTFVEPSSGQVLPYPAGNAIYVLSSQSVTELWTPTRTDNLNPLDTAIDGAVDDLAAYADANNGDQGEPAVLTPGEELGRVSDFQPQCEEPTGGFTSAISFVHDCSLDCSGDTIATVYNFEVTTSDGALGGGGNGTLPAFGTQNVDRYEFGTGSHTWVDVDPFDGDPDRNRENASAPPTQG